MWLKVVVILGVSAFITYLDGKLPVFILTLALGAIMFGIIYLFEDWLYKREAKKARKEKEENT